MKRIKILKNGVVTNANVDPNQSDAEKDAWLAGNLANNSFGKPERWVRDATEDEKLAAIESRDVPDIDGSVKAEYKLAAEYVVVEENMDAEVAAEKASREAREYLNATDWYVIRQMDIGVAIPEDVQKKRQECREVL